MDVFTFQNILISLINLLAEIAEISIKEPKDLLLIRKCVRRMKGGKRKIVNGLIFVKTANLGPWKTD